MLCSTDQHRSELNPVKSEVLREREREREASTVSVLMARVWEVFAVDQTQHK